MWKICNIGCIMQSLLLLTYSLSLLVHAFAIPLQPVLGSPAEPCDPDVCKLPDCFCSGTTVPGNLSAKEIPQIVMISFDDDVNDQNTKLYTELFNDGKNSRKNPNGCNISATFFVSHEYTNYEDVVKLADWRHELSDHTITHRTPTTWWKNASYAEWTNEIGGQQEILHKFANVNNVTGFRAPFLQVGGNKQFKALHDLGFLYDSSMPTPQAKMWPYTLDYKSTQVCEIGPCPTDSFPGLWEVPMIDSTDLNGGLCSMIDDCPTQPTNEDDAYMFLMTNFLAHYNSNRSPFPIFLHASWFQKYPFTYKAMATFIDKILSMDNVYIVSIQQAIEWIKKPTPLKTIKSFKPWSCASSPPPINCHPAVCCYDNGNNHVPCYSEENWITHYFHTCYQPCTKHYPWYGNPDGN